MEPTPAADRLAGGLLIKALIDESAKRPAKFRADEIRHRAAGAAQRRSDAGAGRGLLHRRRQACGRGVCGNGPQPRSPWHNQEHRDIRRAQDARRARDLYRRRSHRLRHAQVHRAVQEPRRHADETAAAAGAAHRQGALRRRSFSLRRRRDAAAGEGCRRGHRGRDRLLARRGSAGGGDAPRRTAPS